MTLKRKLPQNRQNRPREAKKHAHTSLERALKDHRRYIMQSDKLTIDGIRYIIDWWEERAGIDLTEGQKKQLAKMIMRYEYTGTDKAIYEAAKHAMHRIYIPPELIKSTRKND